MKNIKRTLKQTNIATFFFLYKTVCNMHFITLLLGNYVVFGKWSRSVNSLRTEQDPKHVLLNGVPRTACRHKAA